MELLFKNQQAAKPGKEKKNTTEREHLTKLLKGVLEISRKSFAMEFLLVNCLQPYVFLIFIS